MKYAPLTERLSGLGSAKWHIHERARRMKLAGEPVLALTIGEPDVATPVEYIEAAAAAMHAGRTGYSNGRGEPALLKALAAKYSRRSGNEIGTDRILSLPGTQTVLYAIMRTLVGPGDEVLIGDPYYATYEGVVASAGGNVVTVPLRPELGFRMQAADLAAKITPRSRVLLINSPHNPTGAVLSAAEIAALAAVAVAHDLWIVSDEVYEELVFEGVKFASPLDDPALEERVIVASSISKSHAAPGFRSGWCVGPAEFCKRLLPISETMLFGSQPFIADMTALAVSAPSPVAPGMAARYAARAKMIGKALDGVAGLRVHQPQAGMFALIDIRASGLSGEEFAESLLNETGVAVMPGESFGASLAGWLRICLTQSDAVTAEACARIAAFAAVRVGAAA